MKMIDVSTPQHPNTFTMVEDADFDWLNQWKWRPSSKKTSALTYVVRTSKGERKTIQMHRAIAKTDRAVIDHVDGNGLNNQKNNLRSCTQSENTKNARKYAFASSIYKGVSFYR